MPLASSTLSRPMRSRQGAAPTAATGCERPARYTRSSSLTQARIPPQSVIHITEIPSRQSRPGWVRFPRIVSNKQKETSRAAEDALRRASGHRDVAARRLRVSARAVLLHAASLLDAGATEDDVLAACTRARQRLRAAKQVRQMRMAGFGDGTGGDGSGVSGIYRSTARWMYPTQGPHRA